MARPKEKVTDKVDLKEIERLAGLGLTDVEIGYVLDLTEQTINNYKKDNEFFLALKRGKEKADLRVTESLYKKACDGDTTAMIFWLKNRKSKDWRDKHDLDIKQDIEINIGFNED